VLVADDNADIRDLLATRLGTRGFDVTTAADGQAALEIALTEHPDLALLDWVMPVIQGHELCVKLKTDPRTADIPVVMLTARGEESDRLLGLDLGADAYLVKPFDQKAHPARRVAAELRSSGVVIFSLYSVHS
jgi:two-component system phosphate regulon response regulator PhoB